MPLLTQISFLVGLLNFILFTIQIQITDCLTFLLLDLINMQAMNFFAGLLLLLMPEENAFW